MLGLVNVEPSKISGTFPRGKPRKTWNEVIRSDLNESKDSKD